MKIDMGEAGGGVWENRCLLFRAYQNIIVSKIELKLELELD